MKHGMIEWANGTRMWYCHGKLHRSDGPAVERANGDREWYCYDKIHLHAMVETNTQKSNTATNHSIDIKIQ